MKLLSHILNRLNILSVRFTDGGGADMMLVSFTLKGGKLRLGESRQVENISALKGELSSAPLVVAVCGKGVLTKEIASGEIAAMVTSDPEKFVWSIDGPYITFVRREQTDTVLNVSGNEGAAPYSVECLPSESDDALCAVAERFYGAELKWKRLLKPSAAGSLLALMVAKRIRLPVLGVVLLLLTANFIVSPMVNAHYQSTEAELAALRKSVSAAADGSGRRKEAVRQFAEKLPYRFSWLADRIGAAVPDKVVLSELSVAPVTKAVEAGKPVKQNERSVIIRGETAGSEPLSMFVKTLAGLKAGEVRLASVEQDRERPVLLFRIEIAL